jgi:hypothetical protein
MKLSELVDAMEDAGTVDLRGDKVLPFMLDVLGPREAGWERRSRSCGRGSARAPTAATARARALRTGAAAATSTVTRSRSWTPGGRAVDGLFKPQLGPGLFNLIVDMMGIDDEPNAAGTHVGSAYIDGWYSYVEKDLRAILGQTVRGGFSRRYCGGGDRGRCRAILRSTLARAVEASYGATYGGDETCNQPENQRLDDQWCSDAIEHTPAGVVTQPLIHWINRPTFQQAVEADGIGGAAAGGEPRRDGTDGRRRDRRDGWQ